MYWIVESSDVMHFVYVPMSTLIVLTSTRKQMPSTSKLVYVLNLDVGYTTFLPYIVMRPVFSQTL